MKQLTLIRHAKSSWKDPLLHDINRPLNKRGKRDLQYMPQILKSKKINASIIMSSPALRTQETAKAFAEVIETENEVFINPQLYHCSLPTLLKELSQLDSNYQSCIIVGHQPTLGLFINKYSNYSIENFPTTGIAVLEFPIESWEEIQKTQGKLLFYEYPKKYLPKE